MSQRTPRIRWFAVLLAAATICFFSVFSLPGPSSPEVGPLGLVRMDKWTHAIGYAALGGSLVFALADRRDVARAALLAVTIAVAYGAAMELLQRPLPARTCDPADLAANAVGAIVSTSSWTLARILRRTPSSLRFRWPF